MIRIVTPWEVQDNSPPAPWDCSRRCVWVSGVILISFISHHRETWPSSRKDCGGFDQFRLNAATSTCRLAQADFSASISLNQTWV